MVPGPVVSLLLTLAAGGGPASADRAIAFGLFIDSPVPSRVLDESMAIAERLRQASGIDTGNLVADREAAARRAATYLEQLAFQESDLVRAAKELGYDLRPEACRSSCRDIRALAEVELRKRALLALLSSPPAPLPGR
jgi:glutathione S-transferase